MFGEYTKGMFTPWQVLMFSLLDMVDVNWSRKEALRKKDAELRVDGRKRVGGRICEGYFRRGMMTRGCWLRRTPIRGTIFQGVVGVGGLT